MNVTYDGPLPPSKGKKGPPPSRSAAMPPRSPPPLGPPPAGSSVPAFATYDGPLPSGRSPPKAAPQRASAPVRSATARSVDPQEPQAAPPANGSGQAYDGPLPPSKTASRSLPRTATKRAPPPLPGASRSPVPNDVPAGPPLQTFIPVLNAYVKSKVGRSTEAGEYIEAVTALGPLASGKALATGALPQLAQFGALPPSLVPQLLLVTALDDKRAVRLAYYLLQVQLGAGAAGTPSLPPMRGGVLVVPGPVPLEVAARGWQAIVDPAAANWQLHAAMRTLAAATRPTGSKLSKDLATGVEIVLDRAGQVNPMVASGKKAADEANALKRIAIAAARAGTLEARAADRIGRRVLRQVLSSEPLTARHAMAMAVEVARKDPRGVLEGLGSVVADAVGLFEMAGSAAFAPSKAASPTTPSSEDAFNLSDVFARVYLARLCAAVVFSERGGGSAGGPFYQMLTLLATRDESQLVSMEAIRALGGYFPPRNAKMSLDASAPSDDPADLRMRGRAWSVLVQQASAPAMGVVAGAGASTLIGVVGERLCSSLQRNSPALVCSAARSAGALGEARVRSGARSVRGSKQAEVQVVMEELAEELQRVAEGPAGPAVRCAALEALLWFQMPGQAIWVTPSALLRNITAGSVGSAAWARDLLESLLAGIFKAERAMPEHAQLLMACAGAVAAASPSAVNLSRVVEMWSTALKAGRAGKLAALHAALGILSSPSPPSANATTGAGQEELALAAAEGAAWVAFQRMAAWWLGENANVASNEYAGSSGVPPESSDGQPLIKLGSGRVDISTGNRPLSAGEVIALQASENPAMMAVVSQLQHAVLTMPWPVRCAAAQAIAKVAVRSEEPYRIHCYSILRSLAASDVSTGHDPLGVAMLVVPAVRVLDMVYATRITLEDLARRYGQQPLEWPAHVVEQLKERNAAIHAAIETSICSMSAGLYYPLGPVGKELLKAAATEGLEAFQGGTEHAAAKEAAVKAAQEQSTRDMAEAASSSAAISMAPEADVQPAVGADGKPAWLQRLMGSETDSATLRRQHSELSTDDEAGEDGGGQSSSFGLPPTGGGGMDVLAAEMAKLDREIAGPVVERPAWMQRPSPGELAAAAAAHAQDYNSPSHRSQHSRSSSFDIVAEVKQLTGKGLVLHDFDGADDAELTVFSEQQVTVHHEADGWIMCSTEAGRRGLVPASYIRITSSKRRADPFATDDPFASDDPFAGQAEAAFASYDDPFSSQQDDASADPFAEAKYDAPWPMNEGTPTTESSLARGRPDWMTPDSQQDGSRRRSGPAQGDSLETGPDYAAEDGRSSSEEGTPVGRDQELERRPANILFDFDPEPDSDEVAVSTGESVEVAGREVDGWYQIICADGRQGLVPSSYVQL